MRLDKFLKVSRILKRRSVACEAASSGKIDVNGKSAKPAHQLKVGDVITIHFATSKMSFQVLDLKETVKKDEAQFLYKLLEETR